jgi:gas vesicle protein
MSEKMNNKFGEIGTIRDILMGQQMDEYELRFNEIKDLIAKLKEDITKQLDDQGDQFSKALKKLSEETDNRFEKLEKLLEKKIETLQDKVEKNRNSDKHKLGKMLTKIGEQLMDEGKS